MTGSAGYKKNSDNSSAVTLMLEKIKVFLECRNWKSAREYCRLVLDQEPENAQAYVYVLMLENAISYEDQIFIIRNLEWSNSFQRAMQFGDSSLKARLQEQLRKKNEHDSLKPLQNWFSTKYRALDKVSARVLLDKIRLCDTMPEYRQAQEIKAVLQEKIYAKAAALESMQQPDKAAEIWLYIPDYKDSRQRAEKAAPESITVLQNIAEKGTTADSLLKRIQLFIEDKNWKDARIYCKRALEKNPQSAQAHIYMLMLDNGIIREDQIYLARNLDRCVAFQRAMRFGSGEKKEFLQEQLRKHEEYYDTAPLMEWFKAKEPVLNHLEQKVILEKIRLCDTVSGYSQIQEIKDSLQKHLYERAEKKEREKYFADAAKIWGALGNYKDSAERAGMAEAGFVQEQQKQYLHACELIKKEEYSEAAKVFRNIKGYSDSIDKIRECRRLKRKKVWRIIRWGVIIAFTVAFLLFILLLHNIVDCVHVAFLAIGKIADCLRVMIEALGKLLEYLIKLWGYLLQACRYAYEHISAMMN